VDRAGRRSLSITDDASVVGPRSGALTIDAGGKSRVFDVSAGASASLSDLTLTGGRAFQGGAVRNAGDLTLAHVTSCPTRRAGGARPGAVYNTGR